jgi:hypothetical protein
MSPVVPDLIRDLAISSVTIRVILRRTFSMGTAYELTIHVVDYHERSNPSHGRGTLRVPTGVQPPVPLGDAPTKNQIAFLLNPPIGG